MLYVPNIDQNLFSVGQLMEKGDKFNFEKHCLIKDERQNFLIRSICGGPCCFFSKRKCCRSMHKRLGHYHYKGLVKMQKMKIVKDLPILEVHCSNCLACQYGK